MHDIDSPLQAVPLNRQRELLFFQKRKLQYMIIAWSGWKFNCKTELAIFGITRRLYSLTTGNLKYWRGR
jgi:hypothetical protein